MFWFFGGVFLLFAWLTIKALENLRNAKYIDWHCQRCMRHHNNRAKCELCEAPHGWALGDDDGDVG